MHIPIYIYTLTNPLDNKIFYVGRTMGLLKTRLAGHINDCKPHGLNGDKTKLISKIIEYGLTPRIEEIEKIDCYNEQDEAFVNTIEEYWINQFKTWGFVLLNKHKKQKNTLIHWHKTNRTKLLQTIR